MDQCRHTLEQHNWNIEVLLQTPCGASPVPELNQVVWAGFLPVRPHPLTPEFALVTFYESILILLESWLGNTQQSSYSCKQSLAWHRTFLQCDVQAAVDVFHVEMSTGVSSS